MTTVVTIQRLTRLGLTPKKQREYAGTGNNRSHLHRIDTDGAMTKSGVVIYDCPYCQNPQAFRPPPFLRPAMAWQLTTNCCDRNVVVKVQGMVA